MILDNYYLLMQGKSEQHYPVLNQLLEEAPNSSDGLKSVIKERMGVAE